MSSEDPEEKMEGSEAEAEPVVQPEPQKVADLEEDLKAERARSGDYLRSLQYLQADFENYRKRADRERTETLNESLAGFAKDMLTFLDEFDLGIKAAKEVPGSSQLVEGLEVLRVKLYAMLEHHGLQEIDAVGKNFDPDLHEAVERVKVDGSEVGLVVGEVRKGFMFGGKVLRPSAVKVGVKGEEKNEQA